MAYYQTVQPRRDTSDDLARVNRSLQRVTFQADYVSYAFAPDGGVTEADLADRATLALAVDTTTSTRSKGGTAVVLDRTSRGVLLLTNRHVVHYPTREVEHVAGDGAGAVPAAERPVAAASFRTQAEGYLRDRPDLGPFTVVARDTVHDLALLEVSLREPVAPGAFPPMPVPPGDPRRLSWGSYVYVMGFPGGYAMVNAALVSDPSRDPYGGFLTDGLWNEGISGGPILAVRGDTGALEWVGVTRAAAATREVRLQPSPGHSPETLDEGFLYEGPIFLESMLRLQYGITLPVPMSIVREFIGRNRPALVARGYDLRRY